MAVYIHPGHVAARVTISTAATNVQYSGLIVCGRKELTWSTLTLIFSTGRNTVQIVDCPACPRSIYIHCRKHFTK